MSRIDEKLEAVVVAAVEAPEMSADPNAPLPAGTSVTRGHPRARNLQVRFRDDEFAALTAYASQQELPVSTVVRLLVLKAIAPVDDLKAALDRL
jgi:hypothetical protein